ERKEDELDEYSDDEDGEAEVADDVIDPVHRHEQRLGDEIEPAPVDQAVEAVEHERLVVAVNDGDLLGAGEETPGGGRAARGRNREGVEEVVGLIGLQRAELAELEARADLGGGIGN